MELVWFKQRLNMHIPLLKKKKYYFSDMLYCQPLYSLVMKEYMYYFLL